MCGTIQRFTSWVGLGPSPEQSKAMSMMQQGADAAGMGALIGRDQYNWYKRNVRPMYLRSLGQMGDELERMQGEVSRYYSPEYEAEQMQRAGGDWNAGVRVANQARRFQGAAMGLRPEDLDQAHRGDVVRQAAGRAHAMNTTASDLRARRLGGSGMYLGGAGQHVGAMGPAMGAPGQAMAGYGGMSNAYMGNAAQMMRMAEPMIGRFGDFMDRSMMAAGSIFGSGAEGGIPMASDGSPAANPWALAEGGVVEGPGDGMSDSIPTTMPDGTQGPMVSNGEGIIPADVMQHIGQRTLQQLIQKARQEMSQGNAGAPRRFAGGEAQGGSPRRMPLAA